MRANRFLSKDDNYDNDKGISLHYLDVKEYIENSFSEKERRDIVRLYDYNYMRRLRLVYGDGTINIRRAIYYINESLDCHVGRVFCNAFCTLFGVRFLYEIEEML